jgi:hypothetical protein
MLGRQILYLQCKNAGCCHTILLPRSSQLDKFPDRQGSHSRYAEIYVCPDCVHVYDYTPQDVQKRPLRTESPMNLWALNAVGLTFECETEDCGIRTTIRKSTREPRECNTLVEKSLSWVLADVHCGNGHPITSIPSSCFATVIPVP